MPTPEKLPTEKTVPEFQGIQASPGGANQQELIEIVKSAFSGPQGRIGLWQFDPVLNTFQWSANAYRFFGLDSEKSLLHDYQSVASLVSEEDRVHLHARLITALTQQSEFHTDLFVRGKNGDQWIELIGNPCIPEGKNYAVLAGFLQDITQRKLSESELANWKTRNEIVSETAGLLIYDYDILTGDILWSDNTDLVVGFSPVELNRIEKWEHMIHEDDREESYQLLEKAREQLKPYDVYYRFRRKEGGYSHMHDRGLFIPDAKGKAVRMLGIMADVSERIEAERTISESEKSYRELFNTVGEAIFILNMDGNCIDVNQEACALYGYTKEEMIGRDPDFFTAQGHNDKSQLNEYIKNALQGRLQSFEWWGINKKRDVFLQEVRFTKGTYFGEIVIIATTWDRTEKMKAEKALQESEKRFRRLIEDLNVGIILQGNEGRVQMANRDACALLGVTEKYLQENMLNTPDWNFISENGKPILSRELPWRLAAETKRACRGIVIGFPRPENQSTTWMLVNAEPSLLATNILQHVVITLTDITERKQMEEVLKESELRFRTLQEASFGGIGLHKKGVIVDCNQGLCDLTGFTYDELIGSNGLELIAPEYRQLVYDKIIAKEERPYDVEGIRKDGSRYFLEIHGKNIPYEEGLIRVTEFRNITDRKLAEAQIIEQNAKLLSLTENLKSKNDQLREFTQIVSHNLRAPVGNILSLLQFIETAENEPERNEYIGLLKEAGTTTLTTLHELNEVLQIKQNRHIEKQVLKFSDVFSNVRRMLNAKVAEVNASLITDFERAPEIEYPNIYLESILLNLLSNALKYTHPDRKPVIQISTLKENDQITLRVSDNGIGLNMQRYGHQIFKLRKTFHKHPESRGIGLFMIKNQIESMGGDISISSVENEGTMFTIHFNQIKDYEF